MKSPIQFQCQAHLNRSIQLDECSPLLEGAAVAAVVDAIIGADVGAGVGAGVVAGVG